MLSLAAFSEQIVDIVCQSFTIIIIAEVVDVTIRIHALVDVAERANQAFPCISYARKSSKRENHGVGESGKLKR